MVNTVLNDRQRIVGLCYPSSLLLLWMEQKLPIPPEVEPFCLFGLKSDTTSIDIHQKHFIHSNSLAGLDVVVGRQNAFPFLSVTHEDEATAKHTKTCLEVEVLNSDCVSVWCSNYNSLSDRTQNIKTDHTEVVSCCWLRWPGL